MDNMLVISKILGKVYFSTFIKCRLVCSLWYRASFTVVEQWYYWLENYGARKRVKLEAGHEWQPKILKTAPLYQQVYRQGCAKRITRLRRIRNYWWNRQQRAIEKLNDTDFTFTGAERHLRVALEDAKALEQNYLKRKRRKIDISKLTDK